MELYVGPNLMLESGIVFDTSDYMLKFSAAHTELSKLNTLIKIV